MNIAEWATAIETIAKVGGWGIAILFIVGMLAGRIVPRSALADARTTQDARISEAKEQATSWQAAHTASEKTRTEQTALLRDAIKGIEDLTGLLSGPAVPPTTTNGSGPHAA